MPIRKTISRETLKTDSWNEVNALVHSAFAVAAFEHDGSGESDMYWDILVDDLRRALIAHDAELAKTIHKWRVPCLLLPPTGDR